MDSFEAWDSFEGIRNDDYFFDLIFNDDILSTTKIINN